MRNFLHAGLDSSGAWKEKGWKCSREPGQTEERQHYSFLLEVNLPLCASPRQASVHPWARWGANSRSPVRRDKVFPRHVKEHSVFWDVQCLAIGPLPAR